MLSRISRIAGAAVFAAALWAVTALSGRFTVTVEVPLRVYLPSNRALAQPVPQYVEVTMNARGWSLLKLLAVERRECELRPVLTNTSDDQIILFGRKALIENVRTVLSGDATDVMVSPDTLLLAVAPLAARRVPVEMDVSIEPEKGFQETGRRVQPDSVTLYGARRVLNRIASWKTETLSLLAVHSPLRRTLSFADTLNGIVRPALNAVTVEADVQEIAERTFTDVPVHVRTLGGDFALRLNVGPSLITVTVRGGVRDLSVLRPEEVAAWLELRAGVDTLGTARPNITLPPNIHLLRCQPELLRYSWERKAAQKS